ncbi:MAG: serine protease [Sedimentitalea sp.]
MIRLIAAMILTFGLVSGAAKLNAQQEVVWVQVEAHPSLRVAQARAQTYAGLLPDVGGFSLGGNWYGVVLGPYTRPDAERVLQVYLNERRIPQDSFLALGAGFGQQFWPVGATPRTEPVATAPAAPAAPAQVAVAPEPQVSDETPAQARRSERALSRDERKELQIALQAAGFYNAAIDGAFGPGTRGSMRAWQSANGYEESGILTTLQRKVLMDQYNAPLISVGVQMVRDAAAGIEMMMPTKAVAFKRYEAPFAQYDATTDLGARVLLISQPGTQATLFGLYDIMQTLEIVPLDGPRSRNASSFTLEGRGNGIVSYTEARLSNGQIKGFTLIWPAGDEDRRARVLTEMKASFNRLDGVLDPSAGGDAVQSIDLVAGLDVRRPRLSRSGFYVGNDGTLVTTSEAVQACGRITLDQQYNAELVTQNNDLGIAVLRPAAALAPMSVALFAETEPRLQSDVTVAGFSYEGVLGAPTLTFGTLADTKGLAGESELNRLALAALPGDAGGPVMDRGGNVVGMLLPRPEKGQQLPQGVSFAADAASIRALLDGVGLNAANSPRRPAMAPDALNRMVAGMTVLVSCWD